jgi:hypothetical protein
MEIEGEADENDSGADETNDDSADSEMTAETEVAGAGNEAVAQQQPWRRALLVAGRPAFDETIAAEVDRLLSDVDKEVKEFGKGGIKFKNWLPSEEELVLVLWQQKIPYAIMHTVGASFPSWSAFALTLRSQIFLPRHPATSCESRRSILKKQGR